MGINFRSSLSVLALACLVVSGVAQNASKAEIAKNNQAAREVLAHAKGGVKFAPNRILVRFKPGASESDKINVRSKIASKRLGTFKLVKDLELIEAPHGPQQDISAIKNDPRVLYAEPDGVVQKTDMPNDFYFGNMWGLNNANNFDIDAPEAWSLWKGDSNFMIADIDTGIDYNHPDLMANVWTNPGEIPGDGIDNDGNGYIDDVHGYNFCNNTGDPFDDHAHGTHTAGTIGAVSNNGIGVTGINWNCKIVALKFLDASGSGYDSDIIRALDYCVKMNIKVSNNSYGGGDNLQSVRDAIENAKNACGHVFVCAAGNSNNNNDIAPFFPSNYDNDNLISVAAIDSNGNKASFSSYGQNTVDIAAPGVSILSTYPQNRYAYFNGTSMATPHVCGVAALIYSLHPNWTYQQVIRRVLATVKPVASMNGLCVTGGMVSAYNALHNEAPNLAINSPADGAIFQSGGTITCSASAADDHDGNIATKIAWSSDAQGSLGTGATITVSDLAPGTYALSAQVQDDDGVLATRTVTIHVNAAPTVTISSPSEGDAFVHGSTVTFTGSANDAEDGDVTSSIQWMDSQQGSLGAGASVSVSSLNIGSHTVTATARDSSGAVRSNSINITVTNKAPSVSISSPTPGTYNQGSSVSFSASASDLEDGNLSSSVSWSSSIDGALGSGSFSKSNLSAGTHVITATVTDSGGSSASSTVTITIQNTGPTVSISAPTAGTYTQGSAISFAGSASDAQDGSLSGSISWSSSKDGALGTGASFSKSNLTVGSHVITASVTDSGGLSATATVTITVQNTAPTVSITSPATGSTFSSGTSVTFTGTASDVQDGAISSRIAWSSNLQGSLGSGASVTTSSLSPGTHSITASVTDNGGLTSTKTIQVTINATPPLAPTNFKVDKVSSGVAGLSWIDKSNNETGFRIDCEEKKGGKWVNATSFTVGANTTSYTDRPGKGTFHYRITAFNSGGNSATSAWVEKGL